MLEFRCQQLTILENRAMPGYNPNHRGQTPEEKLQQDLQELARRQQEQQQREKGK
jgi:hypothetical protein